MLVVNQASADNFGVPRSSIVGQHVNNLVNKGLQDSYVTLDVLREKRKISKLVTALKTKKQLLLTGTPILGPGRAGAPGDHQRAGHHRPGGNPAHPGEGASA